MPEMIPYLDGHFRVSNRVAKICWRCPRVARESSRIPSCSRIFAATGNPTVDVRLNVESTGRMLGSKRSIRERLIGRATATRSKSSRTRRRRHGFALLVRATRRPSGARSRSRSRLRRRWMSATGASTPRRSERQCRHHPIPDRRRSNDLRQDRSSAGAESWDAQASGSWPSRRRKARSPARRTGRSQVARGDRRDARRNTKHRGLTFSEEMSPPVASGSG